nr:MAG TPA: hypothetical protein [Caudoviricetes sp.]
MELRICEIAYFAKDCVALCQCLAFPIMICQTHGAIMLLTLIVQKSHLRAAQRRQEVIVM